jgi:hypothetical protein
MAAADPEASVRDGERQYCTEAAADDTVMCIPKGPTKFDGPHALPGARDNACNAHRGVQL